MKFFEKLLAPKISKLEAKGNVEALSDFVTSNDRLDIRISAIEALSRIGGDQSIKLLVATLSDEDPDVAMAAQIAISGFDQTPITDLLENLAANGGDIALKILMDLGEPAFEILAGACKVQDEKIRRRALDGLVDLNNKFNNDTGRELFFRAMLAALGDRSPEIRILAAQHLETLGDAKACRGLAAQLKDGDDGVRAACRSTLVALGEPAVPHLLDALADRNVNSRRIGAELLGEICAGDVETNNRRIALMGLVDRGSDANAEISTAVHDALEKIPSELVVNAQLILLADPDHSDHEEIQEFLEQMIKHGSLSPNITARIEEAVKALAIGPSEPQL